MKRFICFLTGIFFAGISFAQSTPLWLRYPSISPDGKQIVFSYKGDIYKVASSGGAALPLTLHIAHDYMPIWSHDGKWIAFVSFLKEEVPADDHPFYKHVYLRLLPIEGGNPKVIAYVYGGQGTMNTPSWSPDSKRIAFVSNTTTK